MSYISQRNATHARPDPMPTHCQHSPTAVNR